VGEVRQGVVSNLANFGAFVDLGGADGLVHISQLAWSRVNHPSEVLKVGQKVEVQVLSVDKEKKKIALSIKRAEVDPWTTVEQRYQIGQLVHGTITKIAPFGAFARIEDGVEGLIHLSELPSGTTEPKQALHEGEDVLVRILRIDPERRRLGLSVRQAAEQPEAGAETFEPEITEAQGAVSAEAPVEGRADVGPAAGATETQPGAEAPAPQRPRAPQREEQPATAMAEAFRLAGLAQQSSSPTSSTSTAEREQPVSQGASKTAATEAPATEAPVQAASEQPANGVEASGGALSGASQAAPTEAEANGTPSAEAEAVDQEEKGKTPPATTTQEA
jgi:small subunit ribosomal protein S1